MFSGLFPVVKGIEQSFSHLISCPDGFVSSVENNQIVARYLSAGNSVFSDMEFKGQPRGSHVVKYLESQSKQLFTANLKAETKCRVWM